MEFLHAPHLLISLVCSPSPAIPDLDLETVLYPPFGPPPPCSTCMQLFAAAAGGMGGMQGTQSQQHQVLSLAACRTLLHMHCAASAGSDAQATSNISSTGSCVAVTDLSQLPPADLEALAVTLSQLGGMEGVLGQLALHGPSAVGPYSYVPFAIMGAAYDAGDACMDPAWLVQAIPEVAYTCAPSAEGCEARAGDGSAAATLACMHVYMKAEALLDAAHGLGRQPPPEALVRAAGRLFGAVPELLELGSPLASWVLRHSDCFSRWEDTS